MKVERVKYVIWAADSKRAVRFYRQVFGAEVNKESEVISEVSVGGATIGIHAGGEGKRTWTGLSFQVPDVIAGAREVVVAGGQLTREPQPEGNEPPHLAMCIDTEGNEFMLTRKRGG
ncbi:MAG: VOC family protein [Verrucomicrobia bacterium]|nr:VOC family protein [Verrucomicrobiota bacterium]MBV8276292.1 VOC family protein [Verrucomicrobiota bacterium]